MFSNGRSSMTTKIAHKRQTSHINNPVQQTVDNRPNKNTKNVQINLDSEDHLDSNVEKL